MSSDKQGGDCLICGKPVPDYEPIMCCSGFECGCMGLPTNPCVCSKRCCSALMDGIGKPYEQRRIDAGIELFKPMTSLQAFKTEIERLDREATAGPWESTVFEGDEEWQVSIHANIPDRPFLKHAIARGECNVRDAGFIAFARTALPDLLRLAEELEAKLKVAEDALTFYSERWHYDMIGTGEQGSTMSLWEPDRELLDDGGNKATEALADIRREIVNETGL